MSGTSVAAKESKQTFQRSVIAAAVTSACVGAPVAYAQDGFEEIIVTATKRSVSLQDVPLAVTAFTDQDIVRQGFKQLDDYVGQVPGLAFARREPGGTTVLMRGCTISGLSFGGSSTTSIYLDEQPITAAGRNPDARLIDIERVEALSGPQGTLYGDASQCGSLRIITNKPDTTAAKGWLDAGVNSVSNGGVGYDISGMANIPLVDGKMALRLVGFLEEEAGYVDNVLSQSPGGTFDNAAFVDSDVNSSTNTGARAMLRTHINDNWTVDLAGIYQQKKLDGFGDTDTNDQFYAGKNLGDLDQIRFNDDSWDDEWYQLSVTAEGSLGFADLMMTGSFFSRETVYEADATSYHFAFNQLSDYMGPYYTIYDFGGDPQGFAYNAEKTDLFTAEIRLSTPADSTSRWSGIVGFFYNRDEGHTLFYAGNTAFDTSPAFAYLNYLAVYYDPAFPLPAPPSGGNWFTGVYDSTLEQYALFGEVGFEVTDNFNITVGGRFFDIDLERTLKQGALFPIGTEPDCSVDFCFADAPGTSDESDFVPKVTLDYHFSDDTMIYGTYSEGFRRGGANAARSSSVFGPGNPYHAYTSDKLLNYEAGIKTTFSGGRVRLNVTAYHMIWQDIQLQANDPNIFTLGIVNFPEANLDGVEAQMSWLPAHGWDISGTLGWNEAEISKTLTLFPTDPNPTTVIKGTQLPIMPDWKGSLTINKSFEKEMLGGTPYINFNYTYNGEATSSLEGIQSIIFVNPVRTLDSYSIADIRFGIDSAKWSAAIFVNNIFDERADQFFNDRWAQTRLSINRPLSYGVTYRRYFE
ncbi:MAG TPA: TonB-dependent receptor [Woeseiaceae bacterium]|nr:TonB-dependent receptor [Woeseiaceae bacterium]